jgi:hypothetical protein
MCTNNSKDGYDEYEPIVSEISVVRWDYRALGMPYLSLG